jgi:hypothetical protein
MWMPWCGIRLTDYDPFTVIVSSTAPASGQRWRCCACMLWIVRLGQHIALDITGDCSVDGCFVAYCNSAGVGASLASVLVILQLHVGIARTVVLQLHAGIARTVALQWGTLRTKLLYFRIGSVPRELPMAGPAVAAPSKPAPGGGLSGPSS